MLRKLGCGVASLAIIVPSAVSALSVEDYTLNSYLSQPLNLQIKLADLRGLSENDIRIGLATPEEFEAAGIEYDALHNNLNFNIDVAADGTGVVSVTTKQPLSEPFISFLVEYKWPSGRLMREYNLLLDPPTYRTSETASEIIPAAATTEPTASTSRTEPKPSSPKRSASTESPTRASGQEHRVSSSDTLWDIAAKNRPDSSISVQQMMVAIQELNSAAFIDGNINLVKEGAVLRLPDADDVRKVTTRDAMAEVATQNRQWQQMLESKGLAPEATAKPLDGKDVADVEGEGQHLEGATDSGRVTLVAADDSLTDSDEQSAAGNDAIALSEDTSRLQRENSELADRLQDLEEQLSLSEELLTLRSQQIAELESKLKELNETAADDLDDEFLAAVEKLEQEQQALVEETEALDLPETEEQSATDAAAANEEEPADEQESATPEEVTEKEDAADSEVKEADADDKSDAEDAVEASKDEEADTKPVAPVVAPEPYEEPSFIDSLLENTMLVFGVLALLLLALALLVMRAVKSRKEQAVAPLAVDEEEGSEDLDNDPFHFGEVEAPSADDLAAEAQALINSEQYEAAVPVLRNAINQDPSRTALRKSLLFALYKTNESAYQQEVVAVRGTNEALDAYIAELALEGESTATDDVLSLDDLEDDLKLGDAAPVLGLDDEAAIEPTEESDELDFDFGELEDSESLSEDDFSFNLDTSLETEATDEDKSFLDDFDFSFDDEATTEESDSEDFSFDLDGETGLGTLELDSDGGVELEDEPLLESTSSFSMDENNIEDTEELPTLDVDEEEFSFGELSLDEHDHSDNDELATLATEEVDEADFGSEVSLDELDLSELTEEEPLLDTEEESFSFDDITLEPADSPEDDSFDLPELTVEEEGGFELEVEPDEALEHALEDSLEAEGLSVETSDDQVDSLLAELEGFDESLEGDDLSSELEHELEQLNQGQSSVQMQEPEVATKVEEAPVVALEAPEDQQFLDPEAEGDPVDTRLNLARAFLDMGDEDIARETLMEVMSEGDDEQKASAQAMLDELDA